MYLMFTNIWKEWEINTGRKGKGDEGAKRMKKADKKK
jgi:hypothetical protein